MSRARRSPWPSSASSASSACALLDQLGPLGRELHLLELAQVAQAEIEDRLGLPVGQLEPRHQRRLRLVLLADDPDHLVEVEEGLEIAFEDLEPVHDLGEAMARAADQHLHAVGEEGLQRLGQAHHPRHAGGIENIQVERQPDLELALAEQLLHQQLGRHRAAARHQHEPDRLRRFVAQVGQQRQLLLRQQFGQALDQAALLDLIGNLGHDHLVLAVGELLPLPARAQAEAAAAGAVGLGDPGRRLDQAAARGQVGPVDVAQHLLDRRPGCRRRAAGHPDQGGQQLAGIVRRDAGRHADRDAGRHRWPAGWETPPAAPRARCRCRRNCRGSRPRPRRCPRAAPSRPRSAGSRCSASPPGYRRRCCRNCPGRRPAGSAGRSPGPAAPARRRPRRRRAGGTCRSRRRRRARTS